MKINGVEVNDLTMDESGRFEVDPIEYYLESNLKELKAECTCCGDRWQVIGNRSHLDWGDISLDSTDLENINQWNQLYVVCEECSEDGEQESVLRGV